MRVAKQLFGCMILGIVIAAGCGGSDEEVGRDHPSGGSSGSSGSAGFGADGGIAASGGTSSGGTSSGGTSSGGTSSGGTSTGGTSTGGTAGSGGCHVTKCQNMIYACGNCEDDDHDGKADMEDPDCLGPCQDNEDSYYGGIPGQPGPDCTVDCYFDKDSGYGNDDCQWNHRCDPLSIPPKYPPEGDSNCAYAPDKGLQRDKTCYNTDAGVGLYEQQSAQCHSYCGPLTPNGCDCFGCCELPAGSGKHVWLGSETDNVGTCTRADVNNPDKCRPCTPVQGCYNPCEKCELCLGKETLPTECIPKPDGGSTGGTGGSAGTGGTGGTTGTCYQQCPVGYQKCGSGCGGCDLGYFCLNGCCVSQPE